MKGRIEHQLATEKNIDKILTTLPEICSDYYNNIAVSKEPMTCQEYIRIIRGFAKYLSEDTKNIDFSQVKESDLARYLRSIAIKRNANGSVEEASFSYRKLNHSILNNFFAYLARHGIQQRNLMENISRVQNTDNVQRVHLTANDLVNIIDGAQNNSTKRGKDDEWACRNVAIIKLFVSTGMRETAMSEINTEDLDLKNGKLTIIDKRHKTHVYVLGSKVVDCLKKWIKIREKLLEDIGIEQQDALFISNRGSRMCPSTIARMVRISTANGIGKELSPHKLRAAFCTVLYEKTGDIELVRDAVGHSNVAVTQRYIVKSDAAKIRSSEIMNTII